MVLELKIQNFLSFKNDVTFSFEATKDHTLEDYYVVTQPDGTRIMKMAMVYGANASGKSNLIKAFDLINDFVENIPEERDEDTAYIPFMFDSSRDEPGTFEMVFYVNGIKHRYELTMDENTVYHEKMVFYPGTQPATLFSRHYDGQKKISVIEFGAKIKISSQGEEAIQLKTLKNTSVFAAYKQVNISIPEMERVIDWFGKSFMSSINPYHSLTRFSDREIQKNPKIKEHALKFLKEADLNITDVTFEDMVRKIDDDFLKMLDTVPIPEEQKAKIKEEKTIHYEQTVFQHKIVKEGKEEYHTLPEQRQSQGTMRYYGLSAPFFHAIGNNAFLPIDEIGSALHPLLIIHFLKEFLRKSEKAQLLFTTHNISLLNEKDILRKDAIWFTEKEEDGATALYSMADFNFRKELSFYNAYKLGKFGAIPEVD